MWEPRPDEQAAAKLGDALRDASYGEETIEELLGEDAIATDLADSVVYARRLGDDAASNVVRLLLLNRPVARDAFPAADALLALGLATEERGTLVPRARIVPTEGVYLTFDTFSHGSDDPEGWVASFSPTAYWLASLTVRRRAARALDVGTGNGAHALLAARHSGHVIATDVNPRALAFTQISAALNGIGNVETRLGSLFEPVAGETFDLITCNAPYVVSPERRWQYRDSGLPGDEVSRQVVTQSAAHLADGGFASMLVSWLAESEDEPDEHVHEWLAGSGCDAWILGLSGSDGIDHAAGWNEHLGVDPDAYDAAIAEWDAYFDELGAGWISEGAVVLHKRAGTHHIVRADPVEEDELEYASEQLERAFHALAELAEHGESVLERRLRLAQEARFDQQLDRSGAVTATTLVLDEGTCPEIAVDLEVAEALTALDGATTIDGAVERVARRHELSKRELAALRRDVRTLARDLLEQGVLELA